LKSVEIDELACLIDFGVASSAALQHLEHLNRLRELAGDAPAPVPGSSAIPALIVAPFGGAIRRPIPTLRLQQSRRLPSWSIVWSISRFARRRFPSALRCAWPCSCVAVPCRSTRRSCGRRATS